MARSIYSDSDKQIINRFCVEPSAYCDFIDPIQHPNFVLDLCDVHKRFPNLRNIVLRPFACSILFSTGYRCFCNGPQVDAWLSHRASCPAGLDDRADPEGT
jgi:hypothetical protein